MLLLITYGDFTNNFFVLRPFQFKFQACVCERGCVYVRMCARGNHKKVLNLLELELQAIWHWVLGTKLGFSGPAINKCMPWTSDSSGSVSMHGCEWIALLIVEHAWHLICLFCFLNILATEWWPILKVAAYQPVLNSTREKPNWLRTPAWKSHVPMKKFNLTPMAANTGLVIYVFLWVPNSSL